MKTLFSSILINMHLAVFTSYRSTTPKRPAGQRPEPFRNPNQTGFALGTGQVTFSGTMIPPFMFTPFGIQYGATYSGTIGGNGAGNFLIWTRSLFQLFNKAEGDT